MCETMQIAVSSVINWSFFSIMLYRDNHWLIDYCRCQWTVLFFFFLRSVVCHKLRLSAFLQNKINEWMNKWIETCWQNATVSIWIQESPADADKPARLKRMQKLRQFDVFRFISPNSISPSVKLPMHSFTRYVESGSRPILLYTVWNPVFANYKVSCLNYKYLVSRLFS